MKFLRFSILLYVFVISTSGWTQTFEFIGSPQNQTLTGENFEINQIDITPLYTNDTAYITYRLIENTCPSGWEFILCDWSACFVDMPNTDDMDPLPPGYNALVKITANARNIDGSGWLEFWIFPTGQMELHESIFFYYNMENDVPENLPSCLVQQNRNHIMIQCAQPLSWDIYNLTGSILQSGFSSAHKTEVDKSQFPQGMYLLKLEDRAVIKFIVE